MVAPVLNDYEYQFGDSGFLLNGGSALPFIDVHKISGLDIPDIDVKDIDYDGQHGGFSYARFVKQRTIIFDGILYANPSNIDATLITLHNNFMPRNDDDYLYIKNPGVVQQYIMCRPIGLNYDVDRLRSVGACNVQIQLRAGDPVKYVDKADISMAAGTNYSILNSGNVETYPVFTVNGPFTEMSAVKNSTGESVGLVYAADADDEVVLDFKKRTCTLNDVRAANLLSSIDWWPLRPGVNETFKVISVGNNIMVNGNCEANFGAGYAMGSRWTGTQQFTGEKHSGSKSLRVVRNSKTGSGGYCNIPTGLTSQPAGNYTVWVWVKGSMPKVTVAFRNAGTQLGVVTLRDVSASGWKKIQFTVNIAATSGALDFVLQDEGQVAKTYKKGQTLYMDDFGVAQINNASMTAVVSSKNGWL